jgi:ABC-2 type transport system ATP-binding protein
VGLPHPLRHVGSLLDAAALQPSRTARNHLLWLAHSQGMTASRVDEVLGQAGLTAVARRRAGGFSLGMRQRLGIAGALLRRPELLVLDEPTNGLDPQGIIEVRDLLIRLNEAGTTVFLSSHVLSEVEALCTRIGIMDRGRLVAQESIQDLRRPTGRVLVQLDDGAAARAVLDGHVESVAGREVVVKDIPVAEVTRRLVGAGLAVHEARAERRSLEDVVLALTGPGSDRVDGGGRGTTTATPEAGAEKEGDEREGAA